MTTTPRRTRILAIAWIPALVLLLTGAGTTAVLGVRTRRTRTVSGWFTTAGSSISTAHLAPRVDAGTARSRMSAVQFGTRRGRNDDTGGSSLHRPEGE